MDDQSLSTEVSTNTEVAVSSGSNFEAPAVIESATPESVDSSSVSTSSDSTPAVYTPNYKVKAYDAEYDIPKEYHGFINEKNEKEFKQLFSKAFATDVLLGKNNKLREQNTALEKIVNEKYTPLNNGLNIVNKFLANEDYDSFFEMMKIPEERLQAWMLNKLRMKDLPEEQQAIYTKNSTTQKKLYELEQLAEQQRQELEAVREQSVQATVQQRMNELDAALNRPDVKSIVSRFDTKLNQAGAFKNEVIQRAQFLYQTKGQDLSAEQAVEEFLKIVAFDSQVTNPNETVITAKNGVKNPTLPNIAGQTTSPAAQKVKSMADLQALKKQAMQAMSHNN